MSAAHNGGGSRHITYRAPTTGTTLWARPTFVPPLMTDPDTVTTTGRRKPAGHNGV